jgi:hypothetical protein
VRLRQVALIARRSEPVAAELAAVFGLKVAYRDPAVGVFGLANVVMPVGGEFVEVLEPMRPDASGARYLVRRGGDAGYMVILHAGDAAAHRRRLEGMGVRIIAQSDHEAYRFTHFHPADCAGVLLSIDDTPGGDPREPRAVWPPAGAHWRDFESEVALGVEAVTLQARDPQAAADRWATLLDRPWSTDGEALTIRLDQGAVRFVAPADTDGTGVVGLDVRVTDPQACLARAAAAGLRLRGDAALICGSAFRPVA